jgi:small subunit ribosomal protein S16
MLVIRMQRTGRKGHAMFRLVVQDSRRTPTSGKLVAQLGNYDPHTKVVAINKEKASFYLGHGAQPSERVARLFKSEGINLPNWVILPDSKTSSTRNPAKRRSTNPEQPEPAEPEAAPTAEDETSTETSSQSEEATPETEDTAATESIQPETSDDEAESASEPTTSDEVPAPESSETTEENSEPESPNESEPETADDKSAKS